jgi:hypothetical protein
MPYKGCIKYQMIHLQEDGHYSSQFSHKHENGKKKKHHAHTTKAGEHKTKDE